MAIERFIKAADIALEKGYDRFELDGLIKDDPTSEDRKRRYMWYHLMIDCVRIQPDEGRSRALV